MDLYVTAEEAATMLGVDVRTLYSYVSRKKLRTLRIAGERQSRYWREDVERLAKIEAAPAHESPLVPVTKVTLITQEGPFYRGHSAIKLAQFSTLEDVARILWQAPQAFHHGLPKLPPHYAEVAQVVAAREPSERAYTLLPLVEQANPRSFDFSPEGYARTGADVVRVLAAIISGAPRLSEAPIHQLIGESLGADEVYQDLIRRILILAADHELDPTTYAVRALANTGVNPYAIALTGSAAFRGRRLRLGRAEQAMRLINEVLSEADPTTPVLQRFRAGEELAGFQDGGVYKGGDPRARAMFEAYEAALGDDADFKRLKAAAAAVFELTGLWPDMILASSFLRHKLNIRQENMSIVAVGRLVGWIAHAMEQFYEYPLIRPRAAYNGALPGSV